MAMLRYEAAGLRLRAISLYFLIYTIGQLILRHIKGVIHLQPDTRSKNKLIEVPIHDRDFEDLNKIIYVKGIFRYYLGHRFTLMLHKKHAKRFIKTIRAMILLKLRLFMEITKGALQCIRKILSRFLPFGKAERTASPALSRVRGR